MLNEIIGPAAANKLIVFVLALIVNGSATQASDRCN
jgi:hypothetical protein